MSRKGEGDVIDHGAIGFCDGVADLGGPPRGTWLAVRRHLHDGNADVVDAYVVRRHAGYLLGGGEQGGEPEVGLEPGQR